MSRSSDNRHDMGSTAFTDEVVETLLRGRLPTGGTERELHEILVAMRVEVTPPRNPSHMAASLAAISRAERRPKRRALRRLALVATAGAMVIATAGVALASDASSPGDALYGIDRAFEVLGFDDGGIDERAIEFNALLVQDETESAFEFLDEVISSAGLVATMQALDRLESLALGAPLSSAEARAKVAELRSQIEANKGDVVGQDGRGFGQSVAKSAKSKRGSFGDAVGSQNPKPSPKDDKSAAPTNAGKKDK